MSGSRRAGLSAASVPCSGAWFGIFTRPCGRVPISGQRPRRVAAGSLAADTLELVLNLARASGPTVFAALS